jgi:2'-5' RNA ligase
MIVVEGMLRLFTAIELPEEIKSSLTSLMSPVKHIRWYESDQLHLTLRFIGEKTHHQYNAILEALKQIHLETFELTLKGSGHFSRKVFWIGVEKNTQLEDLKTQIDQQLTLNEIELERKKFRPHITLGKAQKRDDHMAAKALEQISYFTPQSFQVSQFTLFSSKLTTNNAIHRVEETFPLEV